MSRPAVTRQSQQTYFYLSGIAGFARLTPGDNFEVVIKHGGQKWKSKGRMEKNNSQKWDNPEFTFKCLVGETLSIKVSHGTEGCNF